MPEWMMIVLFFVVVGAIYLVIRFIANAIVDKGADMLSNASKRQRNTESGDKTENLADRYHR